MAAAAHGEVHGRRKPAIGVGFHPVAVRRCDERLNAGRTVRHPGRWWPRRGGQFDSYRDLQSHELPHRLGGRQRQRVVEPVPPVGLVALVGEVHCRLVDCEAEHPLRACRDVGQELIMGFEWRTPPLRVPDRYAGGKDVLVSTWGDLFLHGHADINGVLVPERFYAAFVVENKYFVEMMITVEDQVAGAEHIKIGRMPGQPHLRNEFTRHPYERWIEHACAVASKFNAKQSEEHYAELAKAVGGKRREVLTDDFLRGVAKTYHDNMSAPIRAIMAAYSTKDSTARHWVRLARQRGHHANNDTGEAGMTGSIKQRPNGVWRARYRDENGKEHAAHRATKRDAQRWLDEQTAKIVTGEYVDPRAGRITFRSFYSEWSKRQIWQSNTTEVMAFVVNQFPYADLSINAIRRSHIEIWIKSLSKTLAPATVGTRYRCISRIFKAAIDDRLITVDPTKGVRLPALRRTEAAMKIPTPDQVGAMISAADMDFAVFISICAFAGARLAEANALKVGDVDWMRRTLRISRQVQRGKVGTEPEIRGPKYGSERTVYVADELLIMLSEQIGRRGIARDSDAWLFVGKDEMMPPRQNTISVRWQRTCRDANIQGFTPHSLRHFYASGLIAAGCDVVTVQRALGHAKASTTLNIYAHLWPSAEDRTRAAAAGLIADSLRTVEPMRLSD
jgi:integrase